MAIREVRMAFELAYGVPAASGYVIQRVNDFQPKNLAPLDKTKETSGTSITFQRGRLKGRQFDFTIKAYGYHDMTCYWLALAFGVPTITTVNGAQQHRFLPGGSIIKSATLIWKQVSSAGTLWFRATGCEVKTVKCTIAANGTLMWEFTGHGRYAQNIGAPGVVSDTTAAYIQPIDMSQQYITLNALAWPDPPQGFDITVDNGIAPDWQIQDTIVKAATRDFSRIKIGVTTATASVDAFFDAYIGSMTATEDSGFSDMAPIVYTAKDTTTAIGTNNPSTTITMPQPFVDAVSQDNTDTDTMEKGTIEFGYDTTLASLMAFDLVNALPADGSSYTGH